MDKAFLQVLRVLFFVLPFLQEGSAQCLTFDDNLSVRGSTDLSSTIGFDLKLLQELYPPFGKHNFFFSPFSIWNALVLAYFGSDGRTECQLRQALQVPDKITTLRNWRALEFKYRQQASANPKETLVVANRVFFDLKLPLRQCMNNILHNEMESLDFSKPEDASDKINHFVASMTQGKIREIVSPSNCKNAKLILTNAAYFKGTWFVPFDAQDTRKKEFSVSDNEIQYVDMMSLVGEFKHGYSSLLDCGVLELPYSGKNVAMYIFLPRLNHDKALSELIRNLNTTNLLDALNNTWTGPLSVNVPRFSIESGFDDELMGSLQRMGITDLFSDQTCDLSAFAPMHGLSVSDSIHKAFVEVDEKGTEAGAATALITTKSLMVKFHCDRPFLFFIMDKDNNNILFIGAFRQPEVSPSFVTTRRWTDFFPFQRREKNARPT